VKLCCGATKGAAHGKHGGKQHGRGDEHEHTDERLLTFRLHHGASRPAVPAGKEDVMQPKREQALVGMFVLIAAAVLFATVFTMSGAFGRATTKFHAYFPFAGGLEPGAAVRYAGGPKIGRVDSVQLDPQNPNDWTSSSACSPTFPSKATAA